MDIEKLIDTARGSREADLLLTGGRVVNVFSGEIENASIALSGERIAGLGAYEAGARIIDLAGKCVIPGLIDAHIHIESGCDFAWSHGCSGCFHVGGRNTGGYSI